MLFIRDVKIKGKDKVENREDSQKYRGVVVDSRLKIYDKLLYGLLDYLDSKGLCNHDNDTHDATMDHQIYTLYHKQAFLALELAFKGELSVTGMVHDTEKLVMYGMMEHKSVHMLHVDISRHHIRNCQDEHDLQDCVIDYECARLTKVDKPLNAYATINKYRPETYERLQPVLIQFDIDSPDNKDADLSLWANLSELDIERIFDFNKLAIDKAHGFIQNHGAEEGIKKYYDWVYGLV